jgi:uncharacterized membrane protein
MGVLLLGLLLFLGVHSARIVAEGARGRFIARRGENAWRGVYSLLSALGLVLVVWGYGQARTVPTLLWSPPTWTRSLASLLTLVAFVLITAAYVPRNGIKARLHHPMVLGVKAWALGHLLANDTLADLLLFGGFLVWAVFSYRAARARDRVAQTVYPAGSTTGTVTAVVIGVLAWAAFAFWAHAWLIGVKPIA